ncbi:MAG: serine esterase [Bdellovibrionales bacterium]|nr:serine esterase [Bdellovibrionales bacterium]
MSLKKLKSLEYVEAGVLGAKTAIVLFHGYGANCHDLLGLSEFIKPHGGAHFYFPNGILNVPLGPFASGRAWFPIDMQALDRLMQKGEFRNFQAHRPDGLQKAHDMAHEFLNEINKNHDQVIVGGFSQGAMLSTDLVLAQSILVQHLLILSGAYLNKDLWLELAEKLAPISFFQSHGENDPILPFEGAQALYEDLTKSGHHGVFSGFKGGHEIPYKALTDLSNFLK